MCRNILTPLLLVAALAGCMGGNRLKERQETPSGYADSFIHNGARREAGKNADRCTRCHLVWNWEYGSYRDGDRFGLTGDYTLRSPIGYTDPWRLGVSANTFREYYYTGWWNGPWLEGRVEANPEMYLDGYGPVNEGRSKPEDFKGTVVVVDSSGAGDVRTIQEGLNRASRGDLVFVRPGTYRESVRLRDGIRLWGADPKTTILDCVGREAGIIAANDCDISGFTFTGTGMTDKSDMFPAGVRVLDCDASLVIRGNIFTGDAVFGVLVENSREGGTPVNPLDRYIPPERALDPVEFASDSGPRIIGNTFSGMGVRAIHCVHASPEIANNVFIGNVKAVGMTMRSRPFIHHNVFYRNGISLAISRSMPVTAYNIMLKNAWGQRVAEGSRPVIHHNVAWESPWQRGFGEDGSPRAHVPFPGTGEQTVDPMLVSPEKGDYRISLKSPVKPLSNTKSGYGLIKGYGIQYPPALPCSDSRADGVYGQSDAVRAILTAVDRQNERIKSLEASFSVEYRCWMEVKQDRSGNQISARIAETPFSGTDYRARVFQSLDKRQKSYVMGMFAGEKSLADSGTVFFDGERVRVPGGYFKTDSRLIGDPLQVGERPARENIGGIPLDYDQYLNGAIGPGGTFWYGYLRMRGGQVRPEKTKVDGCECVVVRYPRTGDDQYYLFYLDPKLGYRPRKLEQYLEGRIFRRIDGYRYETAGGIPLPIAVTVTDYAVKDPHAGTVVGRCVMTAEPASLKVNGKPLGK